jgi:hypothetical protein
MIAKEYESGNSLRELSRKYKVCKSKIKKLLLEEKLTMRKSGNTLLLNHSLSYGRKRIKGQVVDYKKELTIINAIKLMEENGNSLRMICKTLTAMKIPTKQKGQKWHPEMIRRILDRS